jgi:hypothetical protein
MKFYEIHRYDNGSFHYVVTRTNKYSEAKVREDVNKMNRMLTDVVRANGTWYEFIVGTTDDEPKHLKHKWR